MIRTLKTAEIFPAPEFPLRVFRVPSHSALGLHRHEFHELVVILAGSGVHLTDSESHRLAAGDVFLIRGDMAHAYEDTADMSLVNILFDPRALGLPLADVGRLPGYHVLFRVEPHLRQRRRFGGRLRLSPDQLARTERLIAEIEAELESRPPGHRFMALAHLMRLIGHLSRCYSESGEPESRPLLRIGEVLSYIEQHADRPVTIRRLAGMAAMSDSSFTRTFRRVTGRAPMDYVIRARVARGGELLKHTDLRVTDIAFRCGFSDSNYFTRQFRRVTGRSPRDYRREAQKPLARAALARNGSRAGPRSARRRALEARSS